MELREFGRGGVLEGCVKGGRGCGSGGVELRAASTGWASLMREHIRLGRGEVSRDQGGVEHSDSFSLRAQQLIPEVL